MIKEDLFNRELIQQRNEFIESCKQGNKDKIIEFLNIKNLEKLDVSSAFLTICDSKLANKIMLMYLFLDNEKVKRYLNIENIFLRLVDENNLEVIKQLHFIAPSDPIHLEESIKKMSINNDLEMLQYFIAQYSIDKLILSEAFIKACEHGNLKIVKYLLEDKSIDIHYKSDYGLRVAGNFKHLHLVKYLLTDENLSEKANPYEVSSDLIITAIMHDNQILLTYLYNEYGIIEENNVKEYKLWKEEQNKKFEKDEILK